VTRPSAKTLVTELEIVMDAQAKSEAKLPVPATTNHLDGKILLRKGNFIIENFWDLGIICLQNTFFDESRVSDFNAFFNRRRYCQSNKQTNNFNIYTYISTKYIEKIFLE
jgi:hypothetical protein